MNNYEERVQALMERLDNLEGCANNPVYSMEIQSIRKELAYLMMAEQKGHDNEKD